MKWLVAATPFFLVPLPAIAADPPPSGFYVGGHVGYGFGNATATLGDPIGGASPFRMANTPAIVVVATAPRPTSSTPSLPRAGAI